MNEIPERPLANYEGKITPLKTPRHLCDRSQPDPKCGHTIVCELLLDDVVHVVCPMCDLVLGRLMRQPNPGSYVMPKGKHAGKKLRKLRDEYLAYCYDNMAGLEIHRRIDLYLRREYGGIDRLERMRKRRPREFEYAGDWGNLPGWMLCTEFASPELSCVL